MTRRPLPARRSSEVITFNVTEGQRTLKYHATVSFYDKNHKEPGEIFLNTGKVGSGIEVLMRDSAIAMSLALQYGCPIDVLDSALSKDEKGVHQGPIGILCGILKDGGKSK